MSSVFSLVPAFKESRLRSLYSDFSHLKDVNPEGFDANVNAWCDLLDQCLIHHTFDSSVTLPGAELAVKLADSTYGQPQGLSVVLDTLVQNGKYVPWSIYKFSSPEPLWSFKDYLSPMRWVERRLRSFRIDNFSLLNGKGGLSSDFYINWEQLSVLGDKIGDEIIAKVNSEGLYSAKLLDSDSFVEMVKGLDGNLSDLDVQVLLIYLSRDSGRVKVVSDYENARRAFIKVDSSAITNDDIGIIKVKVNIKSIQIRTDILAKKLDDEIPTKIQQLLKKGKEDDRIKKLLVQKSYVTNSLNKSLGVLSQLHLILDKINDAQSNVSIYETLKTAKDVLASFNNMISFKDLDEVKLELDQEIFISNELSDAMVVSPDMDEREIEDELRELEEEYRLEQQKSSEAVSEAPDSKAEQSKPELTVHDKKETEKENGAEEEDASLIDKLQALKVSDVKPDTKDSEEGQSNEDVKREESTKIGSKVEGQLASAV